MAKITKELLVNGTDRADWQQFVGSNFTLDGTDLRELVELPVDQTKGSKFGRLVLKPNSDSLLSEVYITDPNDGDVMNLYFSTLFLVLPSSDESDADSLSLSSDNQHDREIIEKQGEILVSSLALLIIILVQLVALAAKK